MSEEKPLLAWAQRKWRAYRAARRSAAELNPGGILRLALEVRALAEAARRVCPPERRLQSRIRGIHEEMRRLAELAATPEFRHLGAEKRQLLRRGLVDSREHLLRVLGQAPAPTRFLQ
ncbi:MAG: hypothetical protein KKA55_09225 [Proteobacteria bacterium]|nr:hypothetical protein [Pseudomonadota bacterium]MBU1595697.1 hypothetical protein [Pseudomonadota bacterium]